MYISCVCERDTQVGYSGKRSVASAQPGCGVDCRSQAKASWRILQMLSARMSSYVIVGCFPSEGWARSPWRRSRGVPAKRSVSSEWYPLRVSEWKSG